MHDLGKIAWVGSVLYTSCTTYHNGRLGSTMVDLDHDLADVCNFCCCCCRPLLLKVKGSQGEDRVVITFNGKFLPHIEQTKEGASAGEPKK